MLAQKYTRNQEISINYTSFYENDYNLSLKSNIEPCCEYEEHDILPCKDKKLMVVECDIENLSQTTSSSSPVFIHERIISETDDKFTQNKEFEYFYDILK